VAAAREARLLGEEEEDKWGRRLVGKKKMNSDAVNNEIVFPKYRILKVGPNQYWGFSIWSADI